MRSNRTPQSIFYTGSIFVRHFIVLCEILRDRRVAIDHCSPAPCSKSHSSRPGRKLKITNIFLKIGNLINLTSNINVRIMHHPLTTTGSILLPHVCISLRWEGSDLCGNCNYLHCVHIKGYGLLHFSMFTFKISCKSL